jgi:hypothetical protein
MAQAAYPHLSFAVDQTMTTSPVVPDGTDAIHNSALELSPPDARTTKDALTPPTVTELASAPLAVAVKAAITIWRFDAAVPKATPLKVKLDAFGATPLPSLLAKLPVTTGLW